MQSYYPLLADLLVLLHLAWVIFMVTGILATVAGIFWRRILAVPYWRWIHLLGLVFSASLGIAGKPCPLTTLEYFLRRQSGVLFAGEESFVIRLANDLIFPDISPLFLSVVTAAAALVVLGVFVWRPPWRS